jgi:hypothetical protein
MPVSVTSSGRTRAGEFSSARRSDPLRTRIHIHRFSAQETYEGLAAFARKFDGETRGGGDRADNRNSRRECFLHDLK